MVSPDIQSGPLDLCFFSLLSYALPPIPSLFYLFFFLRQDLRLALNLQLFNLSSESLRLQLSTTSSWLSLVGLLELERISAIIEPFFFLLHSEASPSDKLRTSLLLAESEGSTTTFL